MPVTIGESRAAGKASAAREFIKSLAYCKADYMPNDLSPIASRAVYFAAGTIFSSCAICCFTMSVSGPLGK
jgi:hypothetical protein